MERVGTQASTIDPTEREVDLAVLVETREELVAAELGKDTLGVVSREELSLPGTGVRSPSNSHQRRRTNGKQQVARVPSPELVDVLLDRCD